jgi:hypothetical protein
VVGWKVEGVFRRMRSRDVGNLDEGKGIGLFLVDALVPLPLFLALVVLLLPLIATLRVSYMPI